MKKIMVMLLAVIMCFAFVACDIGSSNDSDVENAKKEIIGEWKYLESGGVIYSSFIFNEDGTGTVVSKVDDMEMPMTWKYDSDLSSYIVCFGQLLGFHIELDENGLEYIGVGEIRFYRTEE